MSAPPAFEVADVLRRHAGGRGLRPSLSPQQHRVLARIIACRTAALGGHLERCDDCGHERPAYNSCRDRHCPKCLGPRTAAWLHQQQAHLLPVPYFHAVFTLPHLLAPLALQNPGRLYGFLFQASARALLQLARSDPRLGGLLGFLSILHTWGQLLLHHPHVHCLVPAGVLSPDRQRWIPSRPAFLLPVRALSRLFRDTYLALLEDAYAKGRLCFYGDLAPLAEPLAFRGLLRDARALDWCVYLKPPFGGPDTVLKYLARYTHRVAISNSRILDLDDDSVTFAWKDYAHGARPRTTSLSTAEFARRFLLHVLPAGFVRIRSYGLLSNRLRDELLPLCRQLIARQGLELPPAPEPPAPSPAGVSDSPSPSDAEQPLLPGHCPLCRRGLLRVAAILRPVPFHPHPPPPLDSS